MLLPKLWLNQVFMQHNRFRHLPQHRLAFKGVLDDLLLLMLDDDTALLGRGRPFRWQDLRHTAADEDNTAPF